MPHWVAKEKIGTLLLASEMPVPIPLNRTVHHPEPALHGTCGRVGHAQTNTHIYSRAEDVVTASTTINVPLNTAACISGVGATAHTNICTQQLVHIYTL